MQQGWNQDSTSSQSQVHLSPLKLCLDISLKAWPLKKGPPNIKTEQSKSHSGSLVFVDTHWQRGQSRPQYAHLFCAQLPKSQQKSQGNRKVLWRRYGHFMLSKKTFLGRLLWAIRMLPCWWYYYTEHMSDLSPKFLNCPLPWNKFMQQ